MGREGRRGGLALGRDHSHSFKMSPSVWSCRPLCLIVMGDD